MIDWPEPPPGGTVRADAVGDEVRIFLIRSRFRALGVEGVVEMLVLPFWAPAAITILSGSKAWGPGVFPSSPGMSSALTALMLAWLGGLLAALWLYAELGEAEQIRLSSEGLTILLPACALSGIARGLLAAELRRYLPRVYAQRTFVARDAIRDVRLAGPDFGGRIELDLTGGKLAVGQRLFVADREWLCEVIRRWRGEGGDA